MLETPEEVSALQRLLDASAASAGPHMQGIITDDRRLSAQEMVARLQGMCLLTVATVTADGRPLAGPVDGYLLHGSFWFTSGTKSVRMRHLAVRPAVSATYLPGEHLAISVHGRAQLHDLRGPECQDLRKAMFDQYAPTHGTEVAEGFAEMDAVAALIVAEKIFTFHMDS